MTTLETLTPQPIALREKLLAKTKIWAAESDREFSSWLISYGLAREIGSDNDELARFIFDRDSGALVPRESLRAEVVGFGDAIGVRIHSLASKRFDVRIRGFRALCHPAWSENADGSYAQLVIFPHIVSQLAAHEGIEITVVQSWAMNSIFRNGPKQNYYETNFWELENNDSLLFASLVENQRLALLGTHDLIAHVAGLDRAIWATLTVNARRVRQALEVYGGEAGIPLSISDLILPYTTGVVLDDMAQPPSYRSPSHPLMLDALIERLQRTPARLPSAVLMKYPSTFEKVIRLARDSSLTRAAAARVVEELVIEIRTATTQMPANA